MKTQLNRFLHFGCRLFSINRYYMKNLNNKYRWWKITSDGIKLTK